jgi:hypothetical protein
MQLQIACEKSEERERLLNEAIEKIKNDQKNCKNPIQIATTHVILALLESMKTKDNG